MKNVNKYYGRRATGYDAQRAGPGWDREQQAIEKLVTEGPVLDVPCGTGRFFPIYRAKGLDFVGMDISQDMIAESRKRDPDAKLVLGSVMELDLGQHKTAVCNRFLHWLDPDVCQKVMDRLKASCETVIFSVRTGKKHKRGTWTHDWNEVKSWLDGLLIDQDIEVSNKERGLYRIVKCRRPTWDDVLNQFAGRRNGAESTIKRLSGDWAPRMGVSVPNLGPHCPLTVEWWDHHKVKEVLHKAAEADPKMITPKKPRMTDRPMVAFKRGGRYGLIDGRRRSNLFQDKPGRYPVIVIETE